MSDGFLAIAEYASVHRDGTVSMVRMGLDRWAAPLPIGVRAMAYLEMPAHALPLGESEMNVEILGPDKTVLLVVHGSVEVADQKSTVRLAVPVVFSATQYGPHTLSFRVGVNHFEKTVQMVPPADDNGPGGPS